MTQEEFLIKYECDKPIFNAWGNYLKDEISRALTARSIAISTFLKIPTYVRVKDNDSIIAKAFLRTEKQYTNPYNDITDKVGIRFVVLELSDIEIIKSIIEMNENWNVSKDVDFEENKSAKPELFVYQSVHYVVRNHSDINYNSVLIPANTPCEIQIRTLLQHAYAELSHQTVYKSVNQIDPAVKRKLARSMALIEATDELFKEVRQEMRIVDEKYISFIDYGNLKGHFAQSLESLNSSIFDIYRNLVEKYNIKPENVDAFITEKDYILDRVEKNASSNILYKQPIIYFLYYMAANYSHVTREVWAFDQSYLDSIYNDLGIST